MTSSLWAACLGNQTTPFCTLDGQLIRVVESQEQVATTGLVDNLAEQDRLEHLLETAKPAYRFNTSGLHYLLATPFRYPPLRHGSRFGSRFEPSLFYGSRTMPTALAETAYYRLVFWDGMMLPPPSRRWQTQHTLFGANFCTEHGIQLQHPPFSAYQDQISNPHDYRSSQQLGQTLRDTGTQAIEYRSARDPHGGINVALYSPDVFAASRPVFQDNYVCETTPEGVTFTAPSQQFSRFERTVFLINGQLPQPAL